MKNSSQKAKVYERMIRNVMQKKDNSQSIFLESFIKDVLKEELVTLIRADGSKHYLDLDRDFADNLTAKTTKRTEKLYTLDGIEDEIEYESANTKLFKFLEMRLKDYPQLTDEQKKKIFNAVLYVSQSAKSLAKKDANKLDEEAKSLISSPARTSEEISVLINKAASVLSNGGPVFDEWDEGKIQSFWENYGDVMDWQTVPGKQPQIGKGEPQLGMAFQCRSPTSGESDFTPLGSDPYSVKFLGDGKTFKNNKVKDLSDAVKSVVWNFMRRSAGAKNITLTAPSTQINKGEIQKLADILGHTGKLGDIFGANMTPAEVNEYNDAMRNLLQGMLSDNGIAVGTIVMNSREGNAKIYKPENWQEFVAAQVGYKSSEETKFGLVSQLENSFFFPSSIVPKSVKVGNPATAASKISRSTKRMP